MESKFFATLFDLSFKSFVTRRVMGVFYVIWLVLLGLFVVGLVIASIQAFATAADSRFPGISIGAAIGLLVLAPISAIFGLILGRVAFETSAALVLVAENSQQIVLLLSSPEAEASPGEQPWTPTPEQS